MNILMVSAEVAPFAKVGGLGDVVDALSRSLAARGHDVRIVLPLYGDLARESENITPIKAWPTIQSRVGQKVHDIRYWRRGSARARVKIYLVECESLFGRDGIYTDGSGEGFTDSLERATLHAQAALMLPRLLDWPVDILHGHDAEAVPGLIHRHQWYAERELPGAGATVLTIHNLAHQEVHPPGSVATLGLPPAMVSYPGVLEFQGRLNLLKAGILSADQVNTVSPTYARETSTSPEVGCGLEKILASRGEDYGGILNGTDYEIWDPARDPFLAANYSPRNLAGKKKCRTALCREMKLGPAGEAGKEPPICGFVGRLVQQKGVDLMLPILERLAADGFRFAVLGTGERRLEQAMTAVAARHPDRIAFCGEYDNGLAHRIYAGSDLFLMPSEFEPCGLSQMYALKYATPPVVRRTGGLADTVSDTDESGKAGTGFAFDAARPEALLAALRRAAKVWSDREAWAKLQSRGMACDFSWDEAAAAYETLYRRALARPGR